MSKKVPAKIVPLEQEKRTALPTREAAIHLNREEQTLRGWACSKKGPIQPIKVGAHLAWPVADLKRLLGIA